MSLRWVQFDLLAISGEASPTFGHANASSWEICLSMRQIRPRERVEIA